MPCSSGSGCSHQGQDISILHVLLFVQLSSLGPLQPPLHLCTLFSTRCAMDGKMATKFPITLAPFLKNPKDHIGTSIQLILINCHNYLIYRLFNFLLTVTFVFHLVIDYCFNSVARRFICKIYTSWRFAEAYLPVLANVPHQLDALMFQHNL